MQLNPFVFLERSLPLIYFIQYQLETSMADKNWTPQLAAKVWNMAMNSCLVWVERTFVTIGVHSQSMVDSYNRDTKRDLSLLFTKRETPFIMNIFTFNYIILILGKRHVSLPNS